MTIQRIASGPGLPSGFPFSMAGIGDGLCFISGMPALDENGAFVGGTFTEEADLCWRNIVAIAEAAGRTVDDIIYVQCILGDIEHYGELNAWWRAQFPDVSKAPARFTFQAGALPFGAKIEIQAVAGSAG